MSGFTTIDYVVDLIKTIYHKQFSLKLMIKNFQVLGLFPLVYCHFTPIWFNNTLYHFLAKMPVLIFKSLRTDGYEIIYVCYRGREYKDVVIDFDVRSSY